MKRSESFLVYGVTGVLTLILGIAIVFGDETTQQPASTPGDDTMASVGDDTLGDDQFVDLASARADGGGTGDLLSELLGDDSTQLDDEEETPADDGSEPAPDDAAASPFLAGEVPLNLTLGPSRTEENPASGEKYRIVPIQPGDVASELIHRWCPGTDRAVVAALNETVDLDRIAPGQELVLPWIDATILMESRRKRAEAAAMPASSVATPVNATVPVPAAATTYTVKKGESLWTIAAKKVGAKGATAYIEQIVARNEAITDPSRVFEGMEIILP